MPLLLALDFICHISSLQNAFDLQHTSRSRSASLVTFSETAALLSQGCGSSQGRISISQQSSRSPRKSRNLAFLCLSWLSYNIRYMKERACAPWSCPIPTFSKLNLI